MCVCVCVCVQGLDHLHSHQLGHFDIKPSNIFLGSDGSCKLGDFGLCVSLDQVGLFYYGTSHVTIT